MLEIVKTLEPQYKPLSRYPGTERDICFQVASGVAYSQVANAATNALAQTGLIASVQPLDIYQAEGSETKNITIRIQLTSYDKTMTSEEVGQVMDELIKTVTNETDGRVV